MVRLTKTFWFGTSEINIHSVEMSHVGPHERIRVKSSPQVTGHLQLLLVDMCFCLVMSHLVFLHFAGDSHRVVSNKLYVARNLEVG